MTENHLVIGKQISQQQSLVSIYWDYQNIPDKKLANNLLLLGNSLGYVVNRKAYDYWEKSHKVYQ